jgi:prepilin-type N-terminal cleavage/methylation domain-containing protein
MSTKRNSGFTLTELMIVAAIIAVIASIAVPKLMSSRLSTNENVAISTLRSIASAQAQLEASCAIDTDADGGGEFGFFGELAGTAPLRIWDAATQAPVLDVNGTLDPAVLPTPFGSTLMVAPGNEDIVQRSGYYFKIYLPGATNNRVIPGVAETGPAGVGGASLGNMPASDNCETMWCCYAWPVEPELTGNRVFFIDQEGDVLQTLNQDGGSNTTVVYNGMISVPSYDAAYSDMSSAPNPNARTGMGAALGITAQGHTANDGNVWTTVGN